MEIMPLNSPRIVEKKPKRVKNKKYADAILKIEAQINAMDESLCEDCFPLKHSFADGLYIRELHIPAGYFLVGKLHGESYFNTVVQGDMSVLTEEGIKRVTGPCTIIAPPGTKRFGYSHTDTIWVTVHANPTNSTDIDELEGMIHEQYVLPSVGDCKELEAFVNEIASVFNPAAFRELTEKVYSKEKPGFWSDWSEEQQAIYMSGDWEAFSRSRGYSEEEIDELREWIRMKELGEQLGHNPLKLIIDLSIECSLKNVKLDKNNEIALSSHIPTSKKTPYKKGGGLCLE